MLQIHILRQNPDFVIERLKVKNFDASELITNILALDEKKRENQVKLDATLSEANKIAKTIGEIIKSGKQDQATQLKERSVTLKAEAKTMANDLELLNNEINSLLLQIPNIPGIKFHRVKQPKIMRLSLVLEKYRLSLLQPYPTGI